MNLARIRWLALAAAGLILLAGYLSLTKVVTVIADGGTTTVASRAITVGGALKAAGIQLDPRDETIPSTWSLVSNDLLIAVRRATRIQLTADGQTYQTVGGERTPADLLAKWRLALGPDDRILLAGQTIGLDDEIPEIPFVSLELRRAVAVSLLTDGATAQFLSSATTLGQALTEQDVDLKVADSLQPGPATPLNGPVNATLVRGALVHIRVNGEQVDALASRSTVGQALAQAGYALQDLDYSQPAASEQLPEDGEITIVRVREAVQLQQDIIPHDIQWQEDPEAALDTTSIIQPGVDGISGSRVRIRYEDGQEVSRTTEGKRQLVESQTQISGYGTKLATFTEVVDGLTIEYYRKETIFVTSYSPCRSGVSGCLNGTSSGLPVQKGTIATWINWYRALKGTTVYIPGYGFGTIGDVGTYYPDRSRPWMDLAYSDSDYQEWDRWVTVYFTTPVPDNVPLTWPP